MDRKQAIDGLVGRDGERAELTRLVRAVQAGRGGAVLIEGEPGIGKSALLAVAHAEATESACRVLHSVADEFGTRFPLRALMDCLDAEQEADVTSAMVVPGEISGMLSDPVLAAVERLFALVDRLCADSPVVWILDDLQLADDASIAVWGRLSRATEQLPLLLLAACRPVPVRREVSQLKRVLHARDALILRLAPLSPVQAMKLLGELVQAQPGPGLCALSEQAGGNPLYVRELVAALRREHLIRFHSDTIADIDGDDVLPNTPTSLPGVIAEGLGFLSAPAQRALRMAALLGTEFSVGDLATVLRTSAPGLAEPLVEAHSAGVLVESGVRSAFRHPIIWQALYEATPSAARSALHRGAAEALAGVGVPAERVAQQLVAAEDTMDAWVLGWLAGPGSALDGRAPQAAIELLQRAIEQDLITDSVREELETRLVTLLRVLLRFDDVVRIARAALARQTSSNHRQRMAWAMGYVLMYSQPREATEVVLDALDAHDDQRLASRLRALFALICAIDGHDDEIEDAVRQALAAAQRSGDQFTVGMALHAQAIAVGRRSVARAVELTDKAIAVLGDDMETADLRLVLRANRMNRLDQLGRPTEADAALNDLLVGAERSSISNVSRVHVCAGRRHFDAGRWDDALAELESIDEVPDYSYLSIEAHGVWALIAAHRDDPKAALEHVDVLDQSVFGDEVLRNHSGYYFRAKALLAERDRLPRQALAVLESMVDKGLDTSKHNRCHWLPEMARLAREIGDEAAAATAVEVAVADAEKEGLPSLLAAAECCRGLRDGDPALVGRAADRYRMAGRTLQLGLALENVAVLSGQRGDLRAARAAFAEATGIYRALGASWDLTRAEARVRPLGIRRGQHGPRRRPSSGWGALTPTELRVTSLLAEGRSNPDIAAELFLSRRTVQTHVSHILAKLGMQSRIEIARAALEHLPSSGRTVPPSG